MTPTEQSAQELPNWYHKWRRANSNYFPVEERLTKKAHTLGYLETDDLVDITSVLGNPFNIANRVRKANTEGEIRGKTREAIQHLSNPAAALRDMMGIKRWGRQAVSLLKAKDIPIDWRQLLQDILSWDHEGRFVQQQWAREFWRTKALETEDVKEKVETL